MASPIGSTSTARPDLRDAQAHDASPGVAFHSDDPAVDLARSAIDLRLQEAAFQAALSATSRVVRPSLLDFLR